MGAISYSSQRATRCRRAAPWSTDAYSPYPMHHHPQLVPARFFHLAHPYHTTAQSCYTIKFPESPHTTSPRVRPLWTRTLRISRYFSSLDVSLSHALRRLMDTRFFTPLEPKPLPQPLTPQSRMDLYCSYYQV